MCYQPSVFLIQRKCPASLLMSYRYMETVQFKLSLDSLGEIYQLRKSLEGTEFEKVAIVSSDLSTEWKMYCQLHQASAPLLNETLLSWRKLPLLGYVNENMKPSSEPSTEPSLWIHTITGNGVCLSAWSSHYRSISRWPSYLHMLW